MLLQQQGRFQPSAQILKEGLAHYPDSQPLNMCRGISLLNLGDFQEAVDCFLTIQHAPEALPYIVHCYQALGQPEKARGFIRKMQSMKAR
jgi:lipopolysaccharide biosynthesis regulator YciM